jgi:hypothetical protein
LEEELAGNLVIQKKSRFINKHFLKLKEIALAAVWLSIFLCCSGETSFASHRAGISNL